MQTRYESLWRTRVAYRKEGMQMTIKRAIERIKAIKAPEVATPRELLSFRIAIGDALQILREEAEKEPKNAVVIQVFDELRDKDGSYKTATYIKCSDVTLLDALNDIARSVIKAMKGNV